MNSYPTLVTNRKLAVYILTRLIHLSLQDTKCTLVEIMTTSLDLSTHSKSFVHLTSTIQSILSSYNYNYQLLVCSLRYIQLRQKLVSLSLLKPFINHSRVISQTIRQPRLRIMNDNLHLSKLDNTCIQHRQNRIINRQSFSVPPTLKATTPFQTVQHLQGLDKVRYTLVIVMMGGKEKVYHNGQMEGGSQTKSCSLKNGKFIYGQRC